MYIRLIIEIQMCDLKSGKDPNSIKFTY